MDGAAGIPVFYAARTPMPCTAKTLLVISADSKGVVMRPGALRPATAKAAARLGRMRTRLTAGDKPDRKRMATLACVYDAELLPAGWVYGRNDQCQRQRAFGGSRWLRRLPGKAAGAIAR